MPPVPPSNQIVHHNYIIATEMALFCTDKEHWQTKSKETSFTLPISVTIVLETTTSIRPGSCHDNFNLFAAVAVRCNHHATTDVKCYGTMPDDIAAMLRRIYNTIRSTIAIDVPSTKSDGSSYRRGKVPAIHSLEQICVCIIRTKMACDVVDDGQSSITFGCININHHHQTITPIYHQGTTRYDRFVHDEQ